MFLIKNTSIKLIVFILLINLNCTAQARNTEANSSVESNKRMGMNTALADEIKLTLNEAEQAMSEHDWVTANHLLDEGLLKIGSKYISPHFIDDTEMKLILAKSEEQKGTFQNAANIKFKVLWSRLTLLSEKNAIEK